MHELKISHNIIKLVSSSIADSNIEKVSKIFVISGKLNSINKDSLFFTFNIIKRDFPKFHEAVLDFEELELEIFCYDCYKTGFLGRISMFCPNCGGTNIEIKNGKTFEIKGIEVEYKEE